MTIFIESQAQRDALIADLRVFLVDKDEQDKSHSTMIAKIALAALESEVCGYKLRRESNGLFNRAVYFAPPVPVLKPVVCPLRYFADDNHGLVSDSEGDLMMANEVLDAIREAGYPIVGEDQ